MADKKVVIYPGVDFQRALRCHALYLTTENAKRVGRNSVCLFGLGESTNRGDGICIYSTKTAIVIRPN
jgi:hypothetical protein